MIKKRFTWKTEIDLLNSLVEENRQLKQQIEIEKKWQLEKDKYYVKIKEENEMLKKQTEDYDMNLLKELKKQIEDYDMNLLKEFVLFYKKFDGYENSSELRESELDLIDLFLGERYEQ